MRNIEIREKLAPYSSLPGTACIVPGSDWILTAFPALLRVSGATDIPVKITGPVKQFLVQMDLERDCVWISGIALEGCYRLQIFATIEGLFLTVRRAPKEGLIIGDQRLHLRDKILLASGGNVSLPTPCERLSLGNWKAQDWELVRRRNDVREIVPPLFLLGQKTPVKESERDATDSLIDGKIDIFFRAAFSGLFVPHSQDPLHQGILSGLSTIPRSLFILNAAYQKIRKHLLQEKATGIHILPGIKEHPVGRARLHASIGLIDLEWSQGIIRKMIVTPNKNGEITFLFQQEADSFRFNRNRVLNGTSIHLEKGIQVLLDRFQK